MKIKRVTMEEIQYLAHELARRHLEWKEPIPDFSTRYPRILEQCLFAPFQTYRGQLYKGLVKKASIFFYVMIKNHPFQNGNKRIAITSLLLLLQKNGKWINMSTQELYNLAQWIASSDPEFKDETLSAIQKKLSKSLVPFGAHKDN